MQAVSASMWFVTAFNVHVLRGLSSKRKSLNSTATQDFKVEETSEK